MLVKDELARLDARREQLIEESRAMRPSRPLLHPNMAALYRDEIGNLRDALVRHQATSEAREGARTRRSGDSAVLARPDANRAARRPRRNAGIVGAPSETTELVRQVSLVAGARTSAYKESVRVI